MSAEPEPGTAGSHGQRPLDVRIGSATNALHPISGAVRPLGAGRRQWLALGTIAGAAILADQLTKWIVSRALAFGDAVEIVGPFSIRHLRNSGIAFGLFSSATPVVILLTIAAVGAMVYFFARGARRHALLPATLGLVIGGSLSNLADRIRNGHVTDFLDFDYWPAFNLADTFIVVGVGLLFLSFVASERSTARVGHPPFSRL